MQVQAGKKLVGFRSLRGQSLVQDLFSVFGIIHRRCRRLSACFLLFEDLRTTNFLISWDFRLPLAAPAHSPTSFLLYAMAQIISSY